MTIQEDPALFKASEKCLNKQSVLHLLISWGFFLGVAPHPPPDPEDRVPTQPRKGSLPPEKSCKAFQGRPFVLKSNSYTVCKKHTCPLQPRLPSRQGTRITLHPPPVDPPPDSQPGAPWGGGEILLFSAAPKSPFTQRSNLSCFAQRTPPFPPVVAPTPSTQLGPQKCPFTLNPSGRPLNTPPPKSTEETKGCHGGPASSQPIGGRFLREALSGSGQNRAGGGSPWRQGGRHRPECGEQLAKWGQAGLAHRESPATLTHEGPAQGPVYLL